MLELRTLGTLDLRSAGVPVGSVLAQPRRTALLCYLALARPRGYHPRETIFTLFWPEHSSESARHALRQSLYFLRRSLGSDTIVSRGDEALTVDANVVRCDLWEFERALGEGRHEEALAAYQGELLPGFFVSNAPAFERWLDDERARVRRSAIDSAWMLAGRAEGSGDGGGAARWAAHAVRLAPFDEIGLRRQIELLDRLGDRIAALHAFDSFADALEREYELAPSEETDALVARVRDRQLSGPPSPSVGTVSHSGLADERLPEARTGGLGAPLPTPASVPALRPRRIGRPTGDRRLRGIAAGIVLLMAFVATLILQRERADPARPGTATAGTATLGFPAATQAIAPTPGYLLAYELNLQARDPHLQRTDAGRREMLRLYERAIQADSTFAAAHAGLSHAYLIANFGQEADMRYRDALALAEQAALKALALDSLVAYGYDALGKVRLHSYQFADAESLLRKALELDPSLTVPREHLIQLLVFTGRTGEALVEAETAARENELSAYLTAELARALVVNGDCDQAMRHLSRLEDLDPPVARTFPLIAQCRAMGGLWSSAVATMRSDRNRIPYADAVLAFFLARAGERDEAVRILEALLERQRSGNGNAYPIAVAYAGLQEYDAALEWLDAALEDRSVRESIMEPMYADLRRQPGFEPLARRLGIQNLR